MPVHGSRSGDRRRLHRVEVRSPIGREAGRIGLILLEQFLEKGETRGAGRIDAVDDLIPRPDFCMLIYPAYLIDSKDRSKLAESFQIPTDAPPMFLTMAQDDPLGCENVLVPAMELNRLKIPFGLHLFPSGGHGYGHRQTGKPSAQWTDQATAWLRERGYLKRD